MTDRPARRGGPKTAAGKARAAQNSRKHGLSTPPSRDAALVAAIVARARTLAGPGAGPGRLAAAFAVAEADIDLRRIRRARDELLRRPVVNKAPPTRDLIYSCRRLRGGVPGRPDSRLFLVLSRLRWRRFAPAPEAAAALRIDELVRLENYERRAFSRRSAAIAALDAGPPPGFEDGLDEATDDEGDEGPDAGWDAGGDDGSDEKCDAGVEDGTGEREQDGSDEAAATARSGAPEPAAADGDSVAGWAAAAARSLVADMALSGFAEPAIAAPLGLSVPELRARYPTELAADARGALWDVRCALLPSAAAGSARAGICLLEDLDGWRLPPRRRRARRRGPAPPRLSPEEKEALFEPVFRLVDERRGRPPDDAPD